MKYSCVTLVLALILAAGDASAFGLHPSNTSPEGLKEVLDHKTNFPMAGFLIRTSANILERFSEAVHESITGRIYGCPNDTQLEDCANDEAHPIPPRVLEGLRWNDNPPFRHGSKSPLCRYAGQIIEMESGTQCWLLLFYDADKRAHARPRGGDEQFGSDSAGDLPPALIYRVHFGDLQFFHSMASWDNERADQTQERVLAWAEFLFKMSTDKSQSLDQPIAIAAPKLKSVFQKNGYSLRTLMAPHGMADDDLRDKAFGSLLHTVEDSFSEAHVERDPADPHESCKALVGFAAPGKILSFHAYNHQDGTAHKDRDNLAKVGQQLRTPNNPVYIGTKVKELKESGDWEAAKPFFQCIFGIDNPNTLSGPGLGFTLTESKCFDIPGPHGRRCSSTNE